ncbi:MAG: hypothetical protein EOM36_02865, partial [Bacteroidia bacterium]|nr:hypothetical protein [Bacteroidia bacterium]
MSYNDEQLVNMSDEELEQAFLAAKAEIGSPDTQYEEAREEAAEDLEQPVDNEDSDDDADMDAGEEEAEDEGSDADDETPDGEDADAEEEPKAEEEPEQAEVQPTQKHKFKANGREYEFSEDEVREQFPKIFGQAMDYTKKMQAIKPWRKTIDAIEGAQLSHDDVNLMIDVLKGDKDAVAAVLKRTGVDALELDVEQSRYVPKDYGRDDKALAVKDVIEEISGDAEYSTTYKILSKEWDDDSFREMTSDPDLIKLLHVDVKSGMYDRVQPIAEKLKVYDRGKRSNLDYYKEAARVYFNEQAQEEARRAEYEKARTLKESELADKARVRDVKDQQQQRVAVKQEAEKRKAAAPTKKVAGTKKVIDYLDDS